MWKIETNGGLARLGQGWTTPNSWKEGEGEEEDFISFLDRKENCVAKINELCH